MQAQKPSSGVNPCDPSRWRWWDAAWGGKGHNLRRSYTFTQKITQRVIIWIQHQLSYTRSSRNLEKHAIAHKKGEKCGHLKLLIPTVDTHAVLFTCKTLSSSHKELSTKFINEMKKMRRYKDIWLKSHTLLKSRIFWGTIHVIFLVI